MGETLYREGAQPEELFFITSGRVSDGKMEIGWHNACTTVDFFPFLSVRVLPWRTTVRYHTASGLTIPYKSETTARVILRLFFFYKTVVGQAFFLFWKECKS